MKKITKLVMAICSVVLLVFNAEGQSQTNCNNPVPNTYQGQNFGTSDTYTTTADNTSTAITISNAAVTPVTGSTYDIYVKYTNPQGECIEYNFSNATVSVSNNTIVYTFANGQTLPAGAVGCNSFKVWMRFKQTGSSNWQYYLYYTNCSNDYVLPVTLMNYQVTRYLYGSNKAAGIITWETASESNSSHFIIERASGTPYTYTPIGTVSTKAPGGNSSSTLYYKFVDCAPYNGYNYYRLKMIDLDGSYKYSAIAPLNTLGYGTQCPVSCTNPTINGPSTICESGSYSFALPAPATNVTWSINSSIATVSSWSTNSGSFAIVNRNGATGNVTLSASIAGCGTISKTISFGIGSGYTISGPGSFCTSAVYSVPNLPSGTTVNWSASPSWMAYFTNTSGSQVTVNKGNPGTFNLTATISGCGGSSTLTKNYISAGVPSSGDLWTSADQSITLQSWSEGYNYIFENTSVHFRVDGATSATQYSYVGGSISNTPYFDWGYMHFDMEPGSWATFDVTVTVGGCTETLHYTFVAIQHPNYYGYYSVAPSPVSSDLTIYVDDEKLKNQKIQKSPDQVIQRVMIMNKFGTAVAQQTYPSGTRKISLNVSNLPPDMYVAKIFNGKKWVSVKFMKK